MHSEEYFLTPETAELVNSTRRTGHKVLAVGTTTVRVLESCVTPDGTVHAGHGKTRIFLYPPKPVLAEDMLLTNFHLPKSTLLMLVSCFCDREKVLAACPGYPSAVQEPQLGTGHAVQCAKEALAGFTGSILICYGDMPLMRRETYLSLIETHRREGNSCTLLSAVSGEALPYGRIVRDGDGAFARIVEDRDCTPEEKAIRELNVGVYVFESAALWEALEQLRPNNAQGELYLTDAPAHILARGGKVGVCPTCTTEEMLGVNTVEQLRQVEEIVEKRRGGK